jgi:sulfur carrier protein ThiS adenylyltransferase
MKVGIAGVGGIGSNVARHLAQARVQFVKIIDFDIVEAANLNRQFYSVDQVGQKKTASLVANLQQIFPDISVEAIDKQIVAGECTTLFADCDVIVEGFDDRQLKTMLVNELAETGKTIVSASGIAGTDMDSVQVRQIGTCYVVGDLVSDEKNFVLFPPKIAMVAALMAGKVLQERKDG